MGLTPEQQAAELVKTLRTASSGLHPGAAEELERVVAMAIRAAVEGECANLRVTLRLCLEAFGEALTLEEVPSHFHTVARVCRGLCLEGLGAAGAEGGGSRRTIARRNPKARPRSRFDRGWKSWL